MTPHISSPSTPTRSLSCLTDLFGLSSPPKTDTQLLAGAVLVALGLGVSAHSTTLGHLIIINGVRIMGLDAGSNIVHVTEALLDRFDPQPGDKVPS